jgi:hypothetical protein
MKLDIEDVLSGAVVFLLVRLLLFAAALWIGCTLGAVAIVVAVMIDQGTSIVGTVSWIWAGPLLIFSYWVVLNIPFLVFFLIRYMRDEGDGYLTWGIVAGVESLAVMAGWAHVLAHGWKAVAGAWLCWAVLLVMLETGVWFIRQIGINEWARRLAMLRADNAQRRAEREAEAAEQNAVPVEDEEG